MKNIIAFFFLPFFFTATLFAAQGDGRPPLEPRGPKRASDGSTTSAVEGTEQPSQGSLESGDFRDTQPADEAGHSLPSQDPSPTPREREFSMGRDERISRDYLTALISRVAEHEFSEDLDENLLYISAFLAEEVGEDRLREPIEGVRFTSRAGIWFATHFGTPPPMR